MPEQTLDVKVEQSETIESPLLYTHSDGTQGFVHDTYRDFFLVKYFADEINSKSMTIRYAYNHYWGYSDEENPGVERQGCIKSGLEKALILLSGMLKEKELIKLVDEVSKVCFKVKKKNLIGFLASLIVKRPVVKNMDLSNFLCIAQLNLAYEIAYESNLPFNKLPFRLQEKVSDIIDEIDLKGYGLYFDFSGNVQSFIFKSLLLEQKKKLIPRLMTWYGHGTISPLLRIKPDFKIEGEDSKLILDYLSHLDELYLPSDCIPLKEKPLLPSYYLSEYLKKSLKENIDLLQEWINYIKAGKPNSIYVGKVLAELGVGIIVEPMLELLVKAIETCHRNALNRFKYKWACEQPVVEALANIGDEALPYFEKIADEAPSPVAIYVTRALAIMKFHGNEKTVPISEKLKEKGYMAVYGIAGCSDIKHETNNY